MGPELELLLNRLRAVNDGDEGVEPLTDEELASAEAGLLALGQSLVAPEDGHVPSGEEIAAAHALREYLVDVREAISVRAEEAATRAQAAAEIAAEFAPPAVDETVDPPAGDGDGGTVTVDGAAGETPVDPPTEVPVAASGNAPARRRPALPPIPALAARRPARVAPAETATERPADPAAAVLIASADMPGLAVGQEVDKMAWAVAAERRIDAIMKLRNPEGNGQRIALGTIRRRFPEDRQFTGDIVHDRSLLSDQLAVIASGGVCGPVATDYNITTLATPERPVRGDLVQFGASRGGVRYILPHTFAAVTADAPASLWTEANDVNPSAPATKPHATFVCQSVQEAYVDAVTSIVQFGNFAARYFPEQLDQYMNTVDAVHSRLAEATLLASIDAGSTATTEDNYVLGASRDTFTTLDRAIAAYRYRHRAYGVNLRFLAPAFLKDMIRADLTRQLPGDSGGGIERLATTDAEIAGMFAVRGINPTFYIDSPTGAATLQGFGAQGTGQLLPWPSKTICYLFHEGAWMFLDGGELDLGMVRDSTLNATNNFQMFSESFEKAIFRGHESIKMTMAIAPTGGSAGTVAVSSEVIGS